MVRGAGYGIPGRRARRRVARTMLRRIAIKLDDSIIRRGAKERESLILERTMATINAASNATRTSHTMFRAKRYSHKSGWEVLGFLCVFLVLKALHNEGVLLPRLPYWQFIVLVLGVAVGLAGVFELLGRRRA